MARKKKNKNDEEEIDGDGEGFISLELDGHAKRSIAAILLLLLSLLFTLGFFNAAGTLGEKMTAIVGSVFGWGKYLAPLFFAFIGVVLLRKRRTTTFYVAKIIGLFVIFIAILALLHLFPFAQEDMLEAAQSGIGGGFIGYGVASGIMSLAGKIAGALILFAVIAVGAIIAFNMSLVGIGEKVNVPKVKKPNFSMQLPLFGRRKSDDDEYEEDEEYEDEDFDDEGEDADFDDEDFDDDSDDFDAADGQDDIADDDDEDFDDDDTEVIEEKKPTASEKADGIMAKKNGAKKTKPREQQPWQFPQLKLLEKASGSAKGGDVNHNAQIIEDTLSHFNIDVELEDITTGPTVTQYAFTPPSGVKLSKIVALNADLALALAAHPIRIEAPIPGKSLVGIEVPNKETAMVRLRNLLDSDAFEEKAKKSKLMLALGEDVSGDYLVADLGKAPHMLVAGATGAGKSVAINSILLSLLYQNSPEDLKMILVDPKRVELSLYNGIPHLLCDVIVDNGKVLNALKWAVGEMERRYKILQETGSRDLESYKEKRAVGGVRTVVDEDTGDTHEEEMENLPVIVIVIDELADLMSSHGKEVEGAIVRLAQMARAIGIHLIVSTQRPSVEVITGLIKANLPTRIALRVATQIDSRTILDSPGAEKLVGHGDMLFSGPTSASAKRVQGVFVEESEVKKVIDFIKKQKFETEEDIGEDITGGSSIDENLGGVEGDGGGADDVLYEEAKKIVIESGKASTSYIQRRLRVGYSRAARLVDLLEEQGIVGPANGSKPRDVLIAKDAAEGLQYEDAVDDQAQRDKWQA